MKTNSVEGYARSEEIAAGGPSGLERSCERDGIVQAPATRGIDRIEARFHGHGFEPHRHDTYALGLTLSGTQTFHYRGSARFSLPGNIVVLHPDEVHDGAAGTESGLRYRMLYLPPERIVEAVGRPALPFLPTPVVKDETFRESLAEALDDLETEPPDLLLDDLVSRIAAHLWRHADAPAPSHRGQSSQAVLRGRDFLRENSTRTVSSEELEDVTGLDRYTLARQFRATLGTSPHRYLVMRRLERAKRHLWAGGSIADAAFETGFADQSHFTRHFKKTYGMTPGRWVALLSA